jgi:hypothetical protein
MGNQTSSSEDHIVNGDAASYTYLPPPDAAPDDGLTVIAENNDDDDDDDDSYGVKQYTGTLSLERPPINDSNNKYVVPLHSPRKVASEKNKHEDSQSNTNNSNNTNTESSSTNRSFGSSTTGTRYGETNSVVTSDLDSEGSWSDVGETSNSRSNTIVYDTDELTAMTDLAHDGDDEGTKETRINLKKTRRSKWMKMVKAKSESIKINNDDDEVETVLEEDLTFDLTVKESTTRQNTDGDDETTILIIDAEEEFSRSSDMAQISRNKIVPVEFVIDVSTFHHTPKSSIQIIHGEAINLSSPQSATLPVQTTSDVYEYEDNKDKENNKVDEEKEHTVCVAGLVGDTVEVNKNRISYGSLRFDDNNLALKSNSSSNQNTPMAMGASDELRKRVSPMKKADPSDSPKKADPSGVVVQSKDIPEKNKAKHVVKTLDDVELNPKRFDTNRQLSTKSESMNPAERKHHTNIFTILNKDIENETKVTIPKRGDVNKNVKVTDRNTMGKLKYTESKSSKSDCEVKYKDKTAMTLVDVELKTDIVTNIDASRDDNIAHKIKGKVGNILKTTPDSLQEGIVQNRDELKIVSDIRVDRNLINNSNVKGNQEVILEKRLLSVSPDAIDCAYKKEGNTLSNATTKSPKQSQVRNKLAKVEKVGKCSLGRNHRDVIVENTPPINPDGHDWEFIPEHQNESTCGVIVKLPKNDGLNECMIKQQVFWNDVTIVKSVEAFGKEPKMWSPKSSPKPAPESERRHNVNKLTNVYLDPIHQSDTQNGRNDPNLSNDIPPVVEGKSIGSTNNTWINTNNQATCKTPYTTKSELAPFDEDDDMVNVKAVDPFISAMPVDGGKFKNCESQNAKSTWNVSGKANRGQLPTASMSENNVRSFQRNQTEEKASASPVFEKDGNDSYSSLNTNSFVQSRKTAYSLTASPRTDAVSIRKLDTSRIDKQAMSFENLYNTGDDDIDVEVVKQYEEAFNLFLVKNPEFMGNNPELMEIIRVAKLQKILSVTLEVERELEEYVKSLSEQKKEISSHYHKKLLDASRKKAAREMQLQRELETLKQDARSYERTNTWSMVAMYRDSCMSYRDLQEKPLLQVVNDADPISILPECFAEEKNILMNALMCPFDADHFDEPMLRNLRTENATLNQQAIDLENELSSLMQSSTTNVNSDVSWVDSVLCSMDSKQFDQWKDVYMKLNR